MKAERLIQLIYHPENIGSEELRGLATLINRYPYFQTARILYLKALYLNAGSRFRNELKTSTIHIANHKQLFKYLNNQIVFDTTVNSGAKNSLSDIVDERIREIHGHTVISSIGIPAFPQPEMEEEEEIIRFNLREQQTPPPLKDTPLPASRKTDSDYPAFSSLQAENVISNPIILDNIPGVIDDYSDSGSPSSANPEPGEPIRPRKITGSGMKKTAPIQQPDFAAMPGMISEVEEKTAPVLSLDIDLSKEENEDAAYTQNDTNISMPDVPGTEHLTPLAEPEKAAVRPPVTRKPRKQKDELIERFIKNEPAMPRINASEKTDSRDLSKENPYAQEELFSETLAKIYVKQRLYDKAIQTYIKLSLKYPEKSVYFANRIENIKENINQE